MGLYLKPKHKITHPHSDNSSGYCGDPKAFPNEATVDSKILPMGTTKTPTVGTGPHAPQGDPVKASVFGEAHEGEEA